MLDHLGKFTVLELLGKGAMGEVYRGRDPQIGRDVALKTIRPDLSGSDLSGSDLSGSDPSGADRAAGDDLRTRFRREAQAAGVLNHPNIVTIYEFGEQDGLLYLAMEFVPGRTLQALMADGSLSRNDLLEVLAQVCEGLDHAHRHGIVHRDVKPANVMVGREGNRITAKVMDFGVARLSGSNLTETGTVVGTLSYMSPEYLMDGRAGAASDQFAVGVMLWEGLMGENPYKAETTGATVYRIINETDPLARGEVSGLSPALLRILRTTLARDPLGRFPDTTALAQALRAAQGKPGTGEEQATTYLAKAATVPSRPRRRARWPWALAALLALAGGLGLWRGLAARNRPPSAPGFSASNNVVLDEAAKFWEARPADALNLAQSVLAEEPANPRAWALKLTCLYHQNRLVDFGEALQACREQGVKTADMLATREYRALLERDRVRRKLPEDLRKDLLKP